MVKQAKFQKIATRVLFSAVVIFMMVMAFLYFSKNRVDTANQASQIPQAAVKQTISPNEALAKGALKGNFSISRNKGESQPTEEQTSVQTEQESQTSPSPKGPTLSETYTNENLNFQISHPKDWKPEQQGTNTSTYYTGEGATSSQ